MDRITDVLSSMCQAVVIALDNNGVTTIPGQVYIGWPVLTSVAEIIGQGQWQISVIDLPDYKNATRFSPVYYQNATPTISLVATVAPISSTQGTITFSGIPVAGYNIHAFLNGVAADAFYQTAPGDALSGVATGVASAINTVSLSGVTASATGPVVTVTGASKIKCSIGTSGPFLTTEIRRVEQGIQVSIWAPDPFQRASLSESILSTIGSVLQPFLPLSDGTYMRCKFRTQSQPDISQSSYSIYERHIVFDVEYGIMSTISGTTIDAVVAEPTVEISEISSTVYIGG